RLVSLGRGVCRQGPQKGQTRRSSGPKTDHPRAGRQPQNPPSAPPHPAAVDPRPRPRGHRTMNRREMLLLPGSAMAARRALSAEQNAMSVIGYLHPGSPAGQALSSLAALRQGLSEAGYIEGKNLAIEYRWAEDQYDRLPALAAGLVDRKVDMIAAVG